MNWEKLFDLLAYNKDFMQSVEPFKQELELNSTDTLPFLRRRIFILNIILCAAEMMRKKFILQ